MRSGLRHAGAIAAAQWVLLSGAALPSAARDAAPPAHQSHDRREAAASPKNNAPVAGETVTARGVRALLGQGVRDSAGEDLGRIVDVIVDGRGHVIAAVIDFGGFLGVGVRKIAVAWSALRFRPDPETDHITLDLTREQIKAAPEYQGGTPITIVRTPAKGARTGSSARQR